MGIIMTQAKFHFSRLDVNLDFWHPPPHGPGERLKRPGLIGLNPITYGILRFRQLRGGGVGPNPENKVTVIGSIWNLLPIMVWMILVNMQNIKLLAVLLLDIWRHKHFLSRREQVIAIRYLPPGIEQNSKKSLFMAENIFSGTKLYPLCMVFKQNKNPYIQFFETSHFKNNCSNPPPPLVNRFCWNPAKICLKADFLSWQTSLAYSLRIFLDNFSLLSPLHRVLAAWFKVFN